MALYSTKSQLIKICRSESCKMQGEKLSFYSSFPYYWHLHECIVMFTLVDKALLVKFHYLWQESATEAIWSFQTETKMKKKSGPIFSEGLILLVQCFEQTESIQDRPRSGGPWLSEVRISRVVSQMNTLREQSRSGLPVPVCSGREVSQNMGIQKTSVFRILNGLLQMYPYKLQSLQ